MITADQAREVQKAGVSQEEHLENAMNRARIAITETARMGSYLVTLGVPYLSKESFEQMTNVLKKHGFECSDCQWDHKSSRITIQWGDQ